MASSTLPAPSRSQPWAWLGLAALTALLYLPNLGAYDLWAPDEPRFGQVAREMLMSGNWIVPHVNNQVYTDKPPLYFWFIALLALLQGGEVTALAGRLPSALAAIGGVLVTFAIGRRLFNRAVGLIGAIVLASTMVYLYQARTAQLDMLLSFFCFLAVWAFVVCYQSERPRPLTAVVFWAAMALGTLTKGPPGFIVPLGTALVFLGVRGEMRLFRRLYPVAGFLVFAALVLAWLVPMNLMIPKAKSQDLLFTQTIVRYFSAQGHRQPFYYFLLAFPKWFMPWTLFLPSALYVLWPREPNEPLLRPGAGRRMRRWAIASVAAAAVSLGVLMALYELGEFEPATFEVLRAARIAVVLMVVAPWLFAAMWLLIRRFERAELQLLASWALFTIYFFSLSSSKRDQYILPMYPAAALLVAVFLEPYLAGRKPFERKVRIPAALIPAALGGAALFAGVLASIAAGTVAVASELRFDLQQIRLIAGALAIALAAALLVARARLVFGLIVAVMGVFTLYSAFALLPQNNDIKSGRRLCESIDSERGAADRVMTLEIFREEFIFFGHYFVEEYDDIQPVVDALRAPQRAFCITYSRRVKDIEKALGATPVHLIWRDFTGHRKMAVVSNQPPRLPPKHKA
jgi:4-amino-4-deoxy-L-arabinose transferase-like glycosyltransferase